MAKILLIKSSVNFYPFTITYPLGLMYISSALKRDGGHDVKILDARLKRLSPAEIASAALEYKPDVVGISAMHADFQHCRDSSEAIKRVLPDAPIVLGGPFPSADPASALEDKNIAYAVIGEGEATFTELVEKLGNGKDCDGVQGIAFMQDGGMRTTPTRDYINPLDSLPFPDWGNVDIPAYGAESRWSARATGLYMSLYTSRSCPFQCIYCHKIFGKQYRAYSAQRILDEINILHDKYGINEFEVLDDTFNLQRERVMEFCDGIINNGFKPVLSFPSGMRADLLDEEIVKKLKAAGAVELVVAIETGSPRVMKLIKKSLDMEKAKDTIRIIARAGILCRGYFMLGFPTETPGEMMQTIRFASKTRLHLASFMIAKPVPGTELNRMVYGDAPQVFSEHSFQFYSYDLTASNLPVKTLKRIHTFAFMRFYLNPIRALRIMFVHPNRKLILKGIAQLIFRLKASPRTG